MLQPAHIGHHIGYRRLLASTLLTLILLSGAQGQTTQFTYQGKLNDNGDPASGQYDFQFKLFDTQAVGTGTQLGSTVTVANVSVNAGIFMVQLDFGAAVFPGANRFLEIAVKPTSGSTFTLLSPRQPVTSTPYTVRSATAATADTATNATQLGGLPASGFIQNTASQQSGTNFNIGGTGTASILNATTQFNLDGARILGVQGQNNLYSGYFAGASNTSGDGNSFFGSYAGGANTTGGANSFFGLSAGQSNTTGEYNSFFGLFAGMNNISGNANSFFGASAGANSTGGFNSFFGQGAGLGNTTGTGNTFFGTFAGDTNTIGSSNTIIGGNADVGANNLSFATAIGAGAVVNSSNTLLLGRNLDTVQIPGTLNTSGNGLIGGSLGIGTSAPVAKLQVHTTALDQHLYLSSAAPSLVLGNNEVRSSATMNSLFALSTTNGHFGVEAGGLMIATYGNARGNIYIDSNYSGNGVRNVILQPYIGNVGIGTTTPDPFPKLHVEGNIFARANNADTLAAISTNGNGVFGQSTNGVGVYGVSTSNYAGYFEGRMHATGIVSIGTLGSIGSSHLCINASQEIAGCSSSLRYKTAIEPFKGGLELIQRLRPITFTWKQVGMRDVGFGAEEVEKVEPLLVTYNAKGEVEGVKYDRITVALVNAVREQQTQIEQQRREIETLKRRQLEFDALTKLVCADHPAAEVCK